MAEQIELMADYGCYPLWWTNGDGDIAPNTLSLSPETIKRLEKWAAVYNGILDLEDPASSDFQSEEAMEAFDKEGVELWHQLRKELSHDYEVGYFSEKLRKHFINPDEMELLPSSLLMKTTVS